MRTDRSSVLLLLSVAFLTPPRASAQGVSTSSATHGDTVPTPLVLAFAGLEHHNTAPRTQSAASTKSPALAAALSFMIPGAGSYYAGNSAHGMRHLLILGAGVGVWTMGAAIWATNTVDDCLSGDCDSSNDAGDVLMAVGVGALVANQIWSIATAIKDAEDYNRAHTNVSAQAAGDLRLEPVVRVARVGNTDPKSSGRLEPRFGLQLIRVF